MEINEKRKNIYHRSQKGMSRVLLNLSQSSSFVTRLAQGMPFLHNWYSASFMESGASINAGGSIGIYWASLPTNQQCTLFVKQNALKPIALKGWLIPYATRASFSKFESVIGQRSTYGLYITCDNTQDQKKSPKKHVREIIRGTKFLTNLVRR